MTWDVRAIATPAFAAGFRLAGIAVDDVATAEDAATVIARRSAEPATGILLVEQRLLDAMPEPLRREANRRPVPILVPVPSPTWGGAPADAESLILDLLRRAIGYRVKLR